MKKILALTLALIMCLSLFACSSNPEPIEESYNYADSKFVGEYGANVGGEFTTSPNHLVIKEDGTGTYYYRGLPMNDVDIEIKFSWYPEDENSIYCEGRATVWGMNDSLQIEQESVEFTQYAYMYEDETIIKFYDGTFGRIS